VIEQGFADPVTSAQSTFRAVLDAAARPGSLQIITAQVLPPAPLSPGAAALALTLCDQDTPVWLDEALRANPAVADWLRFHCGTRIVEEPSGASFAFAARPAQLPPFEQFNLGSDAYPDRSTTIVLQVESFDAGPALALTGPGIRGEASLRAAPLPAEFAERLIANRSAFPRGVDLLLVAADRVAALPRSVRLLNAEANACM